jgi:hypothetical protein
LEFGGWTKISVTDGSGHGLHLDTEFSRPKYPCDTCVTLQDETGTLNAIVWRNVARKFWRVFRESNLHAIDGVIERHDGVPHLVARRLQDYRRAAIANYRPFVDLLERWNQPSFPGTVGEWAERLPSRPDAVRCDGPRRGC